MSGFRKTRQFARGDQGNIPCATAAYNDNLLIVNYPVEYGSEFLAQVGIGRFDCH